MSVGFAVVLFPGVDDLDVFGPFEVLVNARAAGAAFEVSLVGAHDERPLRTSHGATIVPQGVLDRTPSADVLVIPGGGWNDRAAQGARAEAERGELPAAIRHWHEAGATIASVCTGAGIVAAAGILAGRAITTHHAARAEVASWGAEVLEARVVDDGDIISCGGVTSGLDLGLHLVQRFGEPRLAEEVAVEIEYHRQGPVILGPRSALPGRGSGAAPD